jgi:hypothetical protein
MPLLNAVIVPTVDGVVVGLPVVVVEALSVPNRSVRRA